MFSFKYYFLVLCVILVSACGGQSSTKPESTATQPSSSKGGYYLDDGPGSNPPVDIENIPDAQPKFETPFTRTNRPYMVLGQKYVPMTSYTPYSQKGIASWYGKRYHGKKTSSGEIYDMYGMTAAHTTLPIPSYVKVSNPTNNRSVIVRVNDRGPFKHDRLIDLSYAAAYKLGLVTQGSGMVEVVAIDTSPEGLKKFAANEDTVPLNVKESSMPQSSPALSPSAIETPVITTAARIRDASFATYYVQVGAFKNASNGQKLKNKIVGLDLSSDAMVTNVYNDGLYRVKLGPFTNREEADAYANKVRKQLNISAIVTNQ